jgi:Cu2+-exporting ATPase
VVLDKTGTLTLGQLRLAQIQTLADKDEAECLRIAATLEQGSMHPMAKALRVASPQTLAQPDARHRAGQGVEAEIGGHTYRLGRPEFVTAAFEVDGSRELPATSAGGSLAMLGDESRCLALFAFDDELRPDVGDFVDALRRSGKRVHLLSGDRDEAVRCVAAALGIELATANASPHAKLHYVQALQRQGRVVAMIGDGINDAPVLAQAGVSIAMGDGAWMSQRQADAVLVSGRLGDLRAAFGTCARTLAIIRENLFWALAYNLTAVPLAALGVVTPWMAGIGMSASSLVVVLNSLRLSRQQGTAPAHAVRAAASDT